MKDLERQQLGWAKSTKRWPWGRNCTSVFCDLDVKVDLKGCIEEISGKKLTKKTNRCRRWIFVGESFKYGTEKCRSEYCFQAETWRSHCMMIHPRTIWEYFHVKGRGFDLLQFCTPTLGRFPGWLLPQKLRYPMKINGWKMKLLFPKGSMVLIYLPTWMGDLCDKLVGKCTIVPWIRHGFWNGTFSFETC